MERFQFSRHFSLRLFFQSWLPEKIQITNIRMPFLQTDLIKKLRVFISFLSIGGFVVKDRLLFKLASIIGYKHDGETRRGQVNRIISSPQNLHSWKADKTYFQHIPVRCNWFIRVSRFFGSSSFERTFWSDLSLGDSTKLFTFQHKKVIG